MAKTRFISKKKNRRNTVRPAKRRPSVRKVVVNRPPNPIVRAVRNVIPLLPGSQYITPLADFIFRGFGLSSVGKTNLEAKFFMTGVSAAFELSPSDTFAFSNYCFRREQDDISAGGACYTTVRTVKMKEINITIQNQSKSSVRQGRWTAAFVPYRSDTYREDVQTMAKTQLSMKDISSLPYSKTTVATTPIFLNYKFRGSTDYCSRAMEMSTLYGAVFIAFEDLSREDFTALNTEQFACAIDVSTVMKIETHDIGRSPSAFSYTINSLVQGNETVAVSKIDAKGKSKLLKYSKMENDAVNGCVKLTLAEGYTTLEEMAID